MTESTPAGGGTGPASGSGATTAPSAVPGVPQPRVIPIPPPEPDGTKYLVGLVLTLVASVAAVIVATVSGGKLVPDRFGVEEQVASGESDPDERDLRIKSRVADPEMPEERAVSFAPDSTAEASSRTGRDVDIDEEYLREVQGRLRNTVARPRVPSIGASVGDPVTIIEDWLQRLKDLDLIVRYDRMADVTEPMPNTTAEHRVLYYTANAYVGHTRDDIRRDLYRFVWVSMDELAKSLRDQLARMEQEGAGEPERQMLQDQIEQLADQPTTDFYLLDYQHVPPDDPDYAVYMNR